MVIGGWVMKVLRRHCRALGSLSCFCRSGGSRDRFAATRDRGFRRSYGKGGFDPNISSTRANCASAGASTRSEEHTSELQSLMRISYAVFCLKKKKKTPNTYSTRRYAHPPVTNQ